MKDGEEILQNTTYRSQTCYKHHKKGETTTFDARSHPAAPLSAFVCQMSWRNEQQETTSFHSVHCVMYKDHLFLRGFGLYTDFEVCKHP